MMAGLIPSPTPAPKQEATTMLPMEQGIPVAIEAAKTHISAGIEMSKAKAKTTTFKNQQNNDRHAVRRHIGNALADPYSKMRIAAEGDRWELLKKLRDQKIREREFAGQGSTGLSFPGSHNQELEDAWLERQFEKFLRDGGRGDDRDDEEEGPRENPVKDESGACSEDSEEESDEEDVDKTNQQQRPHPRYLAESEDASSGKGMKYTAQAGLEKKRKWSTTCKACSRGHSMEVGCEDGSMKSGGQVDFLPARNGTKRCWVWVDGEMVVRPL